jgi:small subunit ribosomal protein S6
MTLPPPTYDLTLLLDPDAEEATRAKIVADARAAIEAHGELERLDEWGTRPLSYPIDRRRAADYYLLQFHASTPQLLADLQRSLRITDGILRFRLIKLKPGVPPAPDMRAGAPAARGEATSAPAPTAPAVGEAGGEPDAAGTSDGVPAAPPGESGSGGEGGGTGATGATAEGAPVQAQPAEASEAAGEPAQQPGEAGAGEAP